MRPISASLKAIGVTSVQTITPAATATMIAAGKHPLFKLPKPKKTKKARKPAGFMPDS